MTDPSGGQPRPVSRRAFLIRATSLAVGTSVIGTAAAQPEPTVVKMVTEGGDVYFDPVGLFVEPGDTVKWVLESGTHTATSYTPGNPQYTGDPRIPKGGEPWDSGTLQEKGASFTHTFETAGTYDYYCVPHLSLGMVGRIVVGEPGGPATKSPIPNKPVGEMPDSKTIVEKKTVDWPYIPNVDKSNPPALFWAATGVFSLTSVYLFSVYDRESGRYDDLPESMEDDE